MARHIFLAWTNAVPGHEDEFNAWYEDRHVVEVLATPGFITAQRFELSPVQREPQASPPTWNYLVIYEFEGEVERVHDVLAQHAHLRSFSDACADDHAAWVYSPVGSRHVSS